MFFSQFSSPPPRFRRVSPVVSSASPCPKASAKSRRPSGEAKATAGGGKGRRWKLVGPAMARVSRRPRGENRAKPTRLTRSWMKTRCHLELDGISQRKWLQSELKEKKLCMYVCIMYVVLLIVSVFLGHIWVSHVSEDLGQSLYAPLKQNGWKLKSGSP